MMIKLAKGAIDLAIVTNQMEEMVRFYRDVLGLEDCGDYPTRSSPGGLVHLFRCGSSQIKLVRYPERSTEHSGTALRSTGYRYLTIEVENLEEIVAACRADKREIFTEIKAISSDTRIAIVCDPDGNLVEFLSHEP